MKDLIILVVYIFCLSLIFSFIILWVMSHVFNLILSPLWVFLAIGAALTLLLLDEK